jgi:predicted  nucleic acid-binding Zn-ribbon protein
VEKGYTMKTKFDSVQDEIDYPRMPVYTAKEYDELLLERQTVEHDLEDAQKSIRVLEMENGVLKGKVEELEDAFLQEHQACVDALGRVEDLEDERDDIFQKLIDWDWENDMPLHIYNRIIKILKKEEQA